MRTQATIECSGSPTVGSVLPGQTAGAFSYPLLNRRTASLAKRSRSKTFNSYVKVDASTILPDHLKKWADYANYLQHRIIVGRMYWQVKGTGFVSLHRRTLEQAIHHSILDPMLNWLIENKVIERDGSRRDWTGFEPARRKDGSDGVSIGYRFCEGYDRLPTQRIPCRSVKANNKFMRLQNNPKRMRNYTKVHRHLRRWLRRLNLDLPTALQLVQEANLDPTIAEQGINLSAYIANGDAIDLTVCNYGRVHTAVTRLLAPIRGCLSIDGQRLLELDVACSQPLFLAVFILKTIRNQRVKTLPDILRAGERGSIPAGYPMNVISRSGRIVPVNRSLGSFLPRPANPPPYLPPIPPYLLHDQRKCREYDASACNDSGLQITQHRSLFLPPDLLVFMELCMTGSLYEHLMKQAAWTGDRGHFKKEFFLMLYGPLKDSLMTQLMQREFPSVMAFIGWHKRRHGYKELSREMQRAESRLMIEGVCGSLMEQNPTIPLVTIHDSIMTTQMYVSTVAATIVQEFGTVGIQPTVRTKGVPFESSALPWLLEEAGQLHSLD